MTRASKEYGLSQKEDKYERGDGNQRRYGPAFSFSEVHRVCEKWMQMTWSPKGSIQEASLTRVVSPKVIVVWKGHPENDFKVIPT